MRVTDDDMHASGVRRPDFDGVTFNRKDGPALKCQLDAVRSIMLGGGWHTLAEIRAMLTVSATESAVSARLRDLRKLKFGAYDIEKRVRVGRLWEYHLASSRDE